MGHKKVVAITRCLYYLVTMFVWHTVLLFNNTNVKRLKLFRKVIKNGLLLVKIVILLNISFSNSK